MSMSVIKYKIRDPRVSMCIMAFCLMFFEWCSGDTSSTVDGYSVGDFSTSYSGFSVLMLSYVGYITMLFPVAAVIYEFLDLKLMDTRIAYIIGAVVSGVGMVVSAMSLKSIYSAGDMEFDFDIFGSAGVSSEANLSVFYWADLLIFIGIIVTTIVIGYDISKESIRKNGVKETVRDVTEKMTEDVSGLVNRVSEVQNATKDNRDMKMAATCPGCGNAIPLGKKLCAQCGRKIEAVSEELICPACGEKVIADKPFCASCGASLKREKIITNCPRCGAEVISGKRFCAECGYSLEREDSGYEVL